MNRGDAGHLLLNIKIGGKPLWPKSEEVPEGYITVDELEVSFNVSSGVLKKTLSAGGITWSPADQKYSVFLSQDDTFKMTVGNNAWQVRIVRGADVFSSRLGSIIVGPALSDSVLK